MRRWLNRSRNATRGMLTSAILISATACVHDAERGMKTTEREINESGPVRSGEKSFDNLHRELNGRPRAPEKADGGVWIDASPSPTDVQL